MVASSEQPINFKPAVKDTTPYKKTKNENEERRIFSNPFSWDPFNESLKFKVYTLSVKFS